MTEERPRGRPRGYRLDRAALNALLTEKRLSMTEGAEACGMPLKTLSALATGESGASIKTVRALEAGLGCDAARLFPELGEAAEATS